jgi:hypothetical protein
VARAHQDVKVFAIQDRRASPRNKRPWIVRTAVDGRQYSRSFQTKAEADRYRSSVIQAKTTGELFDEASGEPVSWQPTPDDIQMHNWARRWLAHEWPEWAPQRRDARLDLRRRSRQ